MLLQEQTGVPYEALYTMYLCTILNCVMCEFYSYFVFHNWSLIAPPSLLSN